MLYLSRQKLILQVYSFSEKNINSDEKNGNSRTLARAKVIKKQLNFFGLCLIFSNIH